MTVFLLMCLLRKYCRIGCAWFVRWYDLNLGCLNYSLYVCIQNKGDLIFMFDWISQQSSTEPFKTYAFSAVDANFRFPLQYWSITVAVSKNSWSISVIYLGVQASDQLFFHIVPTAIFFSYFYKAYGYPKYVRGEKALWFSKRKGSLVFSKNDVLFWSSILTA